jgi:hypothetical protein
MIKWHFCFGFMGHTLILKLFPFTGFSNNFSYLDIILGYTVMYCNLRSWRDFGVSPWNGIVGHSQRGCFVDRNGTL